MEHIDDIVAVFLNFFFVFLLRKCIPCYLQNKNFAFEKKYFDSLPLNLLGPFVAYSQPFNLVYK
jgi:hypothetical protein